MAIKAIETRYAGCRFRSRLEARWAVFFDYLDIKWEYEPEGFETSAGPYLPDFRLTGDRLWVEVKGSDELLVPDLPRIQAFANDYALNVLILGELHRPGPPTLPTFSVITPSDHDFLPAYRLLLGGPRPGGGQYWTFHVPVGNPGGKPSTRADGLVGARPDPAITAAFTAARSARFEHGERG